MAATSNRRSEWLGGRRQDEAAHSATLGSSRQRNTKIRTLSQRTLHRHITPVSLNNMFDNGQPQSGSALLAGTGLIDAVKALKNAGQVRRRDANSVILHVKLHGGSLGVQTNSQRNPAFLRSEFDCVLQEVDQHLPNTATVCLDRRQSLFNRSFEPLALGQP